MALGWQAVSMAEPSSWRVNGYGTLGFSMDSDDDSAFMRDLSQRAGRPDESSWKLDSRLGLQASYRFAADLEAVGQLVVRDQESNDWDQSLEWLYGAWRPGAGMEMRVGRVGYDAFLMSDHRHLGYAYPWVRPPIDFYGWIPVFSLDGADFGYAMESADWGYWRIKGQLGQSGLDFPMGDRTYAFDSQLLWSLTLSGESGPWRLHAGYSQIDVDSEIPVEALHQGLTMVVDADVPGISAEAEKLRYHTTFEGSRIRYSSLGLVYDDGDWLLTSRPLPSSVASGPCTIGARRNMTGRRLVLAICSGSR